MIRLKNNIELNSCALDMRKILKEDLQSPIDIFSLINNLKDVTLVFYPMSERISGMCIKQSNIKVIAINSNMSYGRQRFTVAHELYHLFFDEREFVNIVCEKDMNNEKVESEKEADIFASYLLAPYDSLRSYLKEHDLLDKNKINIKQIIEIGQFYQLSHQATLYRLVYDGYIDWSSYNEFNVSVTSRAIRLGYDDKLYKASMEEKKYFSIGQYIEKVEQLKEKELISNGKYEELLLDAFRSDIVYNLGNEEINIYD